MKLNVTLPVYNEAAQLASSLRRPQETTLAVESCRPQS
jgi:hypothetical protein